MADGRHLENRKTAISRQRFDRSAQNLAKMTHFGPPRGVRQLQFASFDNRRWRTAAILKNRKRPYLRNALTDLHKIRQKDAFWTSEGHGWLKFRN